jgi:protein CpxP
MGTTFLKSWRGWLGGALVFALIAGTMPLIAAAQGAAGGGRTHGPFGRGGAAQFGLRQLDLTDAQREQIRGIVQSHRDELKGIADRMRAARQKMQQASGGEAVDESAVRAASADLATALADGSVLRGRVRQEVFSVLTPEQLEKAKTLQANREQRRAHMRERIQERLTPRPANPGQ